MSLIFRLLLLRFCVFITAVKERHGRTQAHDCVTCTLPVKKVKDGSRLNKRM